MSKRRAEIHTYELDTDEHYSVNLKDENGQTVSTQMISNINEARQIKEFWENGKYNLLTETEKTSTL